MGSPQHGPLSSISITMRKNKIKPECSHSYCGHELCARKLINRIKVAEARLKTSHEQTRKYRSYIATSSPSPEFHFLIGVEQLRYAVQDLINLKKVEEGIPVREESCTCCQCCCHQ